MRRIVLYGLVSVFFIVCGCAFKADRVSPSSEVAVDQVVIEKSGTVKQPLYKKPDFTVKETTAENHPVENRLALARKHLDEKQYDRIPPLLEEIARFDPDNKEALDIANQTYYRMGRAFYDGRQYIAARDTLRRVAPDYEDTKLLLASVGVVIEQQAEEHYKKGVRYFINEELTNAILEWEKVLALKPGHFKASNDIENARQLLKQIEGINQGPDPSKLQ